MLVGNNGDDVPRLAAVVERQRRELALARAEADVAAVVAMARGVLMERHGWSVTEAARELTDMAAAAGMPEHEMAAAVLRQESLSGPELAEADHEPRLADDPAAVVAAERARDGAELLGALAEQLRPRFGGCSTPTARWRCWAPTALAAPSRAGGGGCRHSSTARSSGWRSPETTCGN